MTGGLALGGNGGGGDWNPSDLCLIVSLLISVPERDSPVCILVVDVLELGGVLEYDVTGTVLNAEKENYTLVSHCQRKNIPPGILLY